MQISRLLKFVTFGFGLFFLFLMMVSFQGNSMIEAKSLSSVVSTPTPSPVTTPLGGGKSIPKDFILGQNSQSEYGEVAFNHDNHAFKKYSPAGTEVMSCSECQHTDKATLTLEVWNTGVVKVSNCRACHFQDGDVPEGKTMPTMTANGKVKDMNNQLSFHINCNTCHDAAFKARPELKKKAGFATSKDCAVCHKTDS